MNLFLQVILLGLFTSSVSIVYLHFILFFTSHAIAENKNRNKF